MPFEGKDEKPCALAGAEEHVLLSHSFALLGSTFGHDFESVRKSTIKHSKNSPREYAFNSTKLNYKLET